MKFQHFNGAIETWPTDRLIRLHRLYKEFIGLSGYGELRHRIRMDGLNELHRCRIRHERATNKLKLGIKYKIF